MTGRQGHFVQFPHIPGTDDQPSAVRVVFDLLNDLVDLVNGTTIRGLPITPLSAVNPAEIAIVVGPFVPNADAVFVEVLDVSVSAQKPEQLVNYRFEVELFGSQQGESVFQWESLLRAEEGISPSTGAIGFEFALLQNQAE